MKRYNRYYDKYVLIRHYTERRIEASTNWIISKTWRKNDARNEIPSAINSRRMNSKWSPFATRRRLPPTPCHSRMMRRGYHRRRWQRALAFGSHRYASVTTDRHANAVSRPVDRRWENIILCLSVRWRLNWARLHGR